MSSIYDLRMEGITGEQVDFDRFRDQVLLVASGAAHRATPRGTAASFFDGDSTFKVNQGTPHERILAADSEQARDKWVEAIRTVAAAAGL